MKIELMRQSGQPVDLGDRDKYDNDFKAFYDKAAERAGLDMLKLARFMRFGERQLAKKYNNLVEVELPKSEKAWKALQAKYEDCPIMTAVNLKNSKLILIIMDTLSA
jgi:hypothetical protein